MGMGHIACHAYVLDATIENINKLNIDISEIVTAIKENGDAVDTETVIAYLEEDDWFLYANIDGEKVPVDFYVHHDAGRYDELEEGGYLLFGESQLYEKRLSKVGEWLEERNLFPEGRSWTEFG